MMHSHAPLPTAPSPSTTHRSRVRRRPRVQLLLLGVLKRRDLDAMESAWQAWCAARGIA